MPDGQPYEMDRSHVAGGLATAIRSETGTVLVVDIKGVSGALWASVGPTIATPDLVAIEHAWITGRGGWGLRLARSYETWARERGAVKMTLNPALRDERTARLLSLLGFAPVETTWIKRL